jgi:hypothetical protein
MVDVNLRQSKQNKINGAKQRYQFLKTLLFKASLQMLKNKIITKHIRFGFLTMMHCLITIPNHYFF